MGWCGGWCEVTRGVFVACHGGGPVEHLGATGPATPKHEVAARAHALRFGLGRERGQPPPRPRHRLSRQRRPNNIIQLHPPSALPVEDVGAGYDAPLVGWQIAGRFCRSAWFGECALGALPFSLGRHRRVCWADRSRNGWFAQNRYRFLPASISHASAKTSGFSVAGRGRAQTLMPSPAPSIHPVHRPPQK